MATSFNEIVSMEIRAEMARQRRNQSDLASALGWTQVYLSRRLTGSVALSTDEIERIAMVLNVPVDQLVTPARV
jgi:transcriptional regulator with XRE-family HTH domain